MIKNYFITAYRNLLRRKGYAIINVSGLAIGISACLLLFLIVKYELSYDRSQPNYDRIYHIYCKDKYPDGISYNPGIPFPALDALRADLPQVKSGAIYSTYGNQVTINEAGENKKFIEETGVFLADPEFFEVIKFSWLAGSEKVLYEPNALVLSKSHAIKYFKNWKDAIGKTLKLDNLLTFRIAGIIDDAPLNSDFQLHVVGSFTTLKNNPGFGYMPEWGATTSNFQVYMLLPENVSETSVETQLLSLAKKYYKNEGSIKRVNLLRPLKDIHYDEEMGNLGTHVMGKKILMTLSLIGFLIILMACINFVNLSTAQAVGRSKEVGVRKVLGSNRKQLFWQMLGETHFIVLIATIFALIFSWLALPFIKHVVSIEEDLSIFNLESLGFVLVTLVIVTLLAGVYPSLILSGFQPVMALKNKITSATIGGISLRRVLVVVQFSISQILVIGTIVAIMQMNYMRHADLGFNKEAILLLEGNSDSTILGKQPAFKQTLLQMPGIKSVSFASDMPSSDSNSGTNFAYDHKPDEEFTLYLKFGDEDYFKTFGLEFLAGKPYSASDTATDVVINETLLKRLKISSADAAIGKTLRTGGSRWRTICGVVRDFKTNSLREEVKPTMIASKRSRYQVTCIKLRSSNLIHAKEEIQKTWDKFFPDYVYFSAFMDDVIERFYQSETHMALLFKIFAGLAIFISCLGLYGLVSFMVTQKTKEVGIRKVLGAGVKNIVYLFSKEFTFLILLAFVIAAPVSYYFMNDWLSNYVFRINLGLGVFVMAIFLSLLVAWIAVGYKAIKAAVMNPVKSLRTE